MDVRYVMRKYDINKKTLKDFKVNEEERRRIRPTEVDDIRAGFNNKDALKRHFDSPIVVNCINGAYNVIDGNHRLEAIRKKIEEDKDFEITIWVAEYRDLSREEERELYTKWNIGATQTATDFLKVYFSTIPMGEFMLKMLPVDVYRTDKKIGIKIFVGAYIEAKRQSIFTVYSAGGMKTVFDFSQIDMQDIKIMRAFYLDYREVFGEYYLKNPWYKIVGVSAMMRIWYDNKHIKREKLISCFQKVFTAKQQMWETLLLMGGRQASQTFYLSAINELRKSTKIWWKSAMDPKIDSVAE